MAEADLASAKDLSKKFNVVIALLLHVVAKDKEFNDGNHKTGDLAIFLKRHGLGYEDIAAILDSPIGSVRQLVHLKGRAAKKSNKK
jgi:hypothetical protein